MPLSYRSTVTSSSRPPIWKIMNGLEVNYYENSRKAYFMLIIIVKFEKKLKKKCGIVLFL